MQTVQLKAGTQIAQTLVPALIALLMSFAVMTFSGKV